MKSVAFVLSLTFIMALAAVTSSDAGLVGYWPMDEGSGDVVADLSGNSNDGLILGGATWTVGMFGAGVMFDAEGELISVPHSDTLDITGAFTLSAWIYPTEFGSWRGVIGKWGNKEYVYSLWISESNLVLDIGHAECCGETAIVAETSMEANQWTHVAGVSDGTTMTMYIDGEKDPVGGEAPEMPSFGNDFVMGDIDTWGFVGAIDEVRVYNEALEQSEVQRLMDTPSPVSPSGKLAIAWGVVKHR